MDFSKHNQGTTSVKVHYAPGGKSNFSLGWDNNPQPNPTKKTPTTTPNTYVPLQESNHIFPTTTTDTKTSVKVRNPPGGRSNIIFG